MKLPLIHFDYFRKHDPYKVYETAELLLKETSLETLLGGHTSVAFEQTFRQLGATSHTSALSMVTWARSGQNIYVVGPQVAEALRKTDLTGIKPSMVIPEQKVFYIALPECPWQQWGGTETQWHNVTGVYVRYAIAYNPKTMKPQLGLYFNIWGAPNERSRNPLDDVCYWFSVTLDDCPEDSDLETHFGGSQVVTTDDIFGVEAEQVFTQEGLNPYRDLEAEVGLNSEFASEAIEDKDKQRQMARNVFRLAVNLILYLQSEEPDIDVLDREPQRQKLRKQIERAKNPGKRKRFQRRLDNMPKTVIRYIGPKMEQAMREAEGDGETREAGTRSAPRKHLVRPHWRHYWVGKKGSQRKVRKWIALFERGSAEVERTITVLRDGVCSPEQPT